MRLADLPTPQVLVDQARLVANLDRMQALATKRKKRLRPHAKTHKSPAIARMQLARGAMGICCAKLGEAEVFADAGCDDIRLAYPIAPFNAARLRALMNRARLSLIVDHQDVADAWSAEMIRAGQTLDVLVKVDVGFHRCGIDPATPDAAAFVRHIARLGGLRLRGLLSHAGHAYHSTSTAQCATIAQQEAEVLRDLADRVRALDVAIEEVSVGATPTARFSAAEAAPTELRPGNYAYYDRSQVALGSASLDDCALSVLATIVSRPAPDRVILDCGSKTLSSDLARGAGHPTGHGLVYPDPESTVPDETLVVERLSEEHAIVRATRDTKLRPGSRVRVLPNHACVVSNLVDCVRLVDGQTVVDSLPVAARGRIT
jgi:D-serine deaminase-like pyridoxal phosphate-dependent protein